MRLGAAALASLVLAAAAPDAQASCHTHRCWRHVHQQRVEHMTQRRIAAIAVYGPCFGGRWAVPCWVIGKESKGRWSALNTWTAGTPCLERACGPYQFLGWSVPWPVSTLRDKLRHHRQARALVAQYGLTPW